MANAPNATSPMNRLTRQNRLLNGSDFDRVFEHPRRSADRYFTVLYRDNGLGYPRLGLAIARKRVRRATQRNRLKRLIRESFRHALSALPSADVVVMARDAAAAAENAELFTSLDRHWGSLLAGRSDRTTKKLH